MRVVFPSISSSLTGCFCCCCCCFGALSLRLLAQLESSVTTFSSLQASPHHPARITVSQRESRTERSRHSRLEEKTVKGKKKQKQKNREEEKIVRLTTDYANAFAFKKKKDNTGCSKLLVWMLKPSLGRFYSKVFLFCFVFKRSHVGKFWSTAIHQMAVSRFCERFRERAAKTGSCTVVSSDADSLASPGVLWTVRSGISATVCITYRIIYS